MIEHVFEALKRSPADLVEFLTTLPTPVAVASSFGVLLWVVAFVLLCYTRVPAEATEESHGRTREAEAV